MLLYYHLKINVIMLYIYTNIILIKIIIHFFQYKLDIIKCKQNILKYILCLKKKRLAQKLRVYRAPKL